MMVSVLHRGQEGSNYEELWAPNEESKRRWERRPQKGHCLFHPVPESNLRKIYFDLWIQSTNGGEGLAAGSFLTAPGQGWNTSPAHRSDRKQRQEVGPVINLQACSSEPLPPVRLHFLKVPQPLKASLQLGTCVPV